MKPTEKINTFCEQLDNRLKDLERTDNVMKTAFGIDDRKWEIKKLLDFKTEDDVLAFLRDLDSRLHEIENFRSPVTIQNRVQFQFQLIDEISQTMSGIMQKLKEFDIDERFIELFTDDEIKKFYEASGLTGTDVKKFIDKVEKKDVSMPTISMYVNAKINDLNIRSLLGRFFRHEALKKTKKNN